MSIESGRKNLSAAAGGRLWRNLDELAETPQFTQMMHNEFPDCATEWTDDTSRRSFLKLMAASLALAGVTGCTEKPEEKIVPYVRPPEEMVPGRPLFFATSLVINGYARGVLVESHEGRPTKIEGNPDHPASLGATDAIMQASILGLYDPDRSQIVTRNGEVSSWNTFIVALREALAKQPGGQGLRLLTRSITSPTLAAQMRDVLKQYPNARWHQYEPVGCDNTKAGTRLALGQAAQAVYRFDQAKVIVSLDHNFLIDDHGSVRYARQFIDGRRVRHDRKQMNRLYVAEGTPTITGAMADHVVRLKPSGIEATARALLAAISSGSASGGEGASEWVTTVAKDLAANRGASVVVVGESQPPAVHALAHAMNAALGNIGKTVTFIDPVEAEPVNHIESLRSLVADMNAGAVQTLITIGGNPVYDAPADLNFLAAYNSNNVKLRIHHALYSNETSFYSHWHLPRTHELEMWSDARAFDGTASLVQPLIAPLYAGRSPHELLSILTGQFERGSHEIVREYWRGQQKGLSPGDFDKWWEKALHDGVLTGSAYPAKNVTVNAQAVSAPAATTQTAGGIEVAFRPDPNLWDGQFANNAWLQETPRPITKLTWDNAMLMSRATAVQLGVIDVNDAPGNKVETSVVELTVGGRTVRGPAWLVPGQPDGVVTVHLGYGRSRAGRVGNDAGFNAYAIRTSAEPWFAAGATITRTAATMKMACTQTHSMMDQHERNLVHVINVNEPAHGAAADHSGEQSGHRSVSLSLYPEHPYPESPEQGNKWGMVIDQNACIGCNACSVACQAENNIPVVGKDQVALGRDMLWLRIDHYFGGEEADPHGPYFQPVPCMHCENAPCEVVCPVNATVHDAEGLNNMVYNRCVGTRYCSNNCPYKVRRFNFLHYTKNMTGPLALMANPDVTVRYRGVMEKCTYCVQRINHGRIDAKREFVNGERDVDAIKDGEVVTACAQACPTQAIFFGNLNDRGAAVAKLAAEPENYGLLDELQTQPRTTYLPRYVNPGAAAKTEGVKG
jgi:MoCo/4Fe-4S cofactor protein with predicted Tat translocation signal